MTFLFSPKKRAIYDYAMSLVGLPYIWGGDDPINGFDCSGLVIELLIAQGKLAQGFDTTANGLYYQFSSKSTSKPAFGALAFYGSLNERITHVGWCLDRELMLEAGGGGSATRTAHDAAAQNAYIRIRPINSRRDLVAVVKP